MESEKQDKIVSFELTQKMPFPLEELVWDYLVIDDDGIEQEIMAFAVKKANAEQLLELFFQHGLSPVDFTQAPYLINGLSKKVLKMKNMPKFYS